MNVRARTQGFTLTELLAVFAVLAIIAMLAAPSFTTFLAKKRVEGATTELVTDLLYARSEAVQRREPVHVTFGDRCYVVHTTTAGGSCTAAGASSVPPPGVELKTVQLGVGSSLQLVPNGAVTRYTFEPQRGALTTTPSSVNVDSSIGGFKLRAIVTGVGRVRTCTPDGSVPGYSTDCS